MNGRTALRKLARGEATVDGRTVIDKLSSGEATAEAIPNAKSLMLEEMGHDLPRPLWDTIVGAITDHTIG